MLPDPAATMLARLRAARATPQQLRDHLVAPLAFRAGDPEFRRDHVANALLAARRAQVLAEAIAALAAAGIPAALLKGASYAATLYADPADRPMHDVDVLVPGARHDAARAALGALGYRDRGRPAERSRLAHAVGLQRGRDVIDLHRSIAQPVRARIDLDRVWRDARPCVERTDGALRLAPVDEALFHFIHVARTQMYAPAIAYIDGALLLARLAPDDRVALDARARQWHVHRAVTAAIAMTTALTEPAGGDARRGWRDRLLASPDEVLRYQLPPRPVQLARKALLLDRPSQLAGFAAVAAAMRLRPRR